MMTRSDFTPSRLQRSSSRPRWRLLALAYPRTHDLGVLIDLLAKGGVVLPDELADIDRLTPFGTVFRYDEILAATGQDRHQWLDWIRLLRTIVVATAR